MAATSLLARGWFSGRLGGWLATSGVLAATLAVLVLVSALFAGMQAETESRVADVFTGELRITPVSPGVFGPGLFEDLNETLADLPDATARMEAQAILSRVSFSSILVGGEAPTVQGGGGTGDVSLGVLVGVDFADPQAAASYEGHLVDGTLPETWDESRSRIPVAVSVRTLSGFLTDEEKEQLGTWPPAVEDVRALQLELTAGVARDGDFRKDVYRKPAEIVALFDTGLETLDSFTIWGPIEAARYLLGHAGENVANVLVMHDDPGSGRQAAQENDWATESSGTFTARYLGQLIEALRTLSMVTASVLFTIPAFLVAHGVERVLEAQKREVAVLRAMGVPGWSIRRAMGRLVLWTVSLAMIAAAAVIAVFGILLHGLLPGWRGSPVPLDVVFTPFMVGAAAAVAVGSCLVAFWFAWRGQSKQSLPSELRL